MYFRAFLITLFLLFPVAAGAAVEITIAEGNEISLPDEYASPKWSAVWYFEDGTRVPDALLRVNSSVSVSLLSNVGYVYAVLTDTEDGTVRRTNGVNADRIRTKVATLKFCGTGTTTSLRLVNNGVTSVSEFSVEIAGIVAEAPNGIATVTLPVLVGEYDVKVNYPERVGAMMFDNAGICSLEIDESCRNLVELSLDGNSLDFGGLPSWLPAGCHVSYGSQARVHISTLSDGVTVDLSPSIGTDRSVKVTWLDDAGEVIGEDCYERDGRVYTFTGYSGKAWCRMESENTGLVLQSSTVSIGGCMQPVLCASWAGASGNAVFSISVSERVSVSIDDGPAAVFDREDEIWLRMPGKSGSMTLYVSDASAVSTVDMRGTGLYDLELTEGATGVTHLLLGDNAIMPGLLPRGIPVSCEVDWGKQATVDISGLADRYERWIDLTGMGDVDVIWTDGATGETLESVMVTERPRGLFTFAAGVSSVRGVLMSRSAAGLVWETGEVVFPVYDSGLGSAAASGGQIGYRVENGCIVSDSGSVLSVYTPDGRLKCKIAPKGLVRLSSGLYAVCGDGVSGLVRL